MALGARFQKLREGAGGRGGLAIKRAEFSEGHREHSQRETDSQWLTCFSVKLLFLRQHFY